VIASTVSAPPLDRGDIGSSLADPAEPPRSAASPPEIKVSDARREVSVKFQELYRFFNQRLSSTRRAMAAGAFAHENELRRAAW
jgi:hypothetical protein